MDIDHLDTGLMDVQVQIWAILGDAAALLGLKTPKVTAGISF
ncbi:hypothetical protein ACFSMW_06145 [Virgibacillus halophilus]|uniref:Uncharacterized protein n=1 Tax=Tigheibacillus halophilus TaxID=361280 RepID=A0ABU5C4Y8_9BACI|nr:hypothetical protein [Virgibacillus halophilus]